MNPSLLHRVCGGAAAGWQGRAPCGVHSLCHQMAQRTLHQRRLALNIKNVSLRMRCAPRRAWVVCAPCVWFVRRMRQVRRMRRAAERARCVHVRLPVPCLRSLSPRRACRPRAVPVCPAGWGRGRGTRTAWCCGALGVCACACGVWSGHVRCVRCCACGGARAVGSRVGRVWCWCWCCACSLACVVCACGAGRSGRVGRGAALSSSSSSPPPSAARAVAFWAARPHSCLPRWTRRTHGGEFCC